MNHFFRSQQRPVTRRIIAIILFFSVYSFFLPESAAERFFQKNSTWYEKIPANAVLHPDSANIVAGLASNRQYLSPNYKDWGVGSWYANANTPTVTVDVWAGAATKEMIQSRGWHQIPIPPEARAPGNDVYCDYWNGLNTTGKRDGHMVVVSADRKSAWDFYHALWCNNQWHTQTVRKWDLTGDGINYPFDISRHSVLRQYP